MVDEKTPLTGGTPNYAFKNGFPLFGRRNTQLQCCIGATCFALLILILVVLISYITVVVERDIESSIEEGQNSLDDRDDLEKSMPVLQSASPNFRHQKSIATSSKADHIGRGGYAMNKASKWFATKRNHDPSMLSQICSPKFESTGWCIKRNKSLCSQSRYRSINGTCNNLLHPEDWGASYSKFLRTLPPQYEDGISEPRGGLKNSYLPPASVVSRLVHRPAYKNDPNFTVMLAVWGQFIDHDITATALSQGKNGEAITCCNQKKMHPECFPVVETLSDGTVKCMDFVRSAPISGCCLGHREQLNQATAYLDGSVIYGSDEKLAASLRTFKGGQLKMLTNGPIGKYLLPISKDLNDGCNRKDMADLGKYCFISGDARANENLFLTTMHLIWARQHNRLALELSKVNPQWTDEQIYQETRHLVAAQLQHITYNEFLPIILGQEEVNKHELFLMSRGYFYGYNVTIPGQILNNFAAAAFRFAHTLIPGMYRKFRSDNSSYEYFKLHQMLFNPFRLYENQTDAILHEAIDNHVELSDQFFTEELKEHLFERPDESKSKNGLDLVALNIQRGRDHGLPPYIDYRRYCGLEVPKNFEDLTKYMDEDSAKTLSELYKKVEHIDLYTGGLSEKQLPSGLLGPTLNCLIRKQFIILQFADRYWYETPEQPQAYSPDQLTEIRKTTLSSIICHNSDSMKYIPKFVMREYLEKSIVLCNEIPGPNLTYWRRE